MQHSKRLVLESSLEHLDQVVEVTEGFLSSLGLDEDTGYNVLLLTTEAVTNAMEHGNGGDTSKKVVLEFAAQKTHVIVAVEDEGKGFDPTEVANPLDSENLMAEGGRGIYLMEELADEVVYENGGRRIVMRFRRRQEQ